MDTLENQHHWEALTPTTKELFKIIAELPFIHEFYLAGGTGLALHLGHRFSVDLDFFGDSAESVNSYHRTSLIKILSNDPLFSITIDKEGTFVAAWKDVGISFFRLDVHPQILPTKNVQGIRIATIEEIGAMKLAALLSRGNRKDYIDLYFILQQTSLQRLFEIAAQKYPFNPAFPTFVVRALSFFDDAEADPMPKMIKSLKWETVKKFLEKHAFDLGKSILELEKLWPED